MIHTICYTSKANNLSKEEVEQIFSKTYNNNVLRGITGVILYGLGDFLQVLEGPEDIVLRLYEDVIKNDERHCDIFEIINKPHENAMFKDYSSGFNVIRTSDQVEQIIQYLRGNKLNSTSNKLQRLLTPFSITL